jgi:hypothetical protein
MMVEISQAAPPLAYSCSSGVTLSYQTSTEQSRAIPTFRTTA